MLGTPDIFATLVFDGVTFLGHLPLRATSLGRLLPVLCFATTLLLGRAGFGFTLERDLLRERAILHLHIVDHSSEHHNLGVFLFCVDPRAIRHHIVMHLVQLLYDFRRKRDVLHDPRAFELINKG